MKFYIMVAGHSYTPKNKLEDAYQNLVKDMDRTIVPDYAIKETIADFKKKVENLNKQFSRCKPLKISVQELVSDQQYYIYPQLTHFNWYLSKDYTIGGAA